jgi:hypothetical protein
MKPQKTGPNFLENSIPTETPAHKNELLTDEFALKFS